MLRSGYASGSVAGMANKTYRVVLVHADESLAADFGTFEESDLESAIWAAAEQRGMSGVGNLRAKRVYCEE